MNGHLNIWNLCFLFSRCPFIYIFFSAWGGQVGPHVRKQNLLLGALSRVEEYLCGAASESFSLETEAREAFPMVQKKLRRLVHTFWVMQEKLDARSGVFSDYPLVSQMTYFSWVSHRNKHYEQAQKCLCPGPGWDAGNFSSQPAWCCFEC